MTAEHRTLEYLARRSTRAASTLVRRDVENACELFDADFGIVWSAILSPAHATGGSNA